MLVTIIIVISTIVLLGLGAVELGAYLALGKLKDEDKGTELWLRHGVMLSLDNSNLLYKPGGPRFEEEVYYIQKHRPTLFSAYYVEASDKSFRVLRGSRLHFLIKSTHDELRQNTSYERKMDNAIPKKL